MRSCERMVLGAALAAAALAPGGAARAQDPPDQPNIVFVMADDQTFDSTRYQPNVRRLQAQGTTFTQTFATYPFCCPSRATYLSGQYSHNHGVLHNAGRLGGYWRFDHANSLPLWLQAAGYRTMHVGRYLNGYGVQNLDIAEVPPGWSDWVSVIGKTVFNYERWQTNENGQIFWRPGPDRPNEHQTDFLGRRAAALVADAAASDQPFFLSLTPSAPHLGQPQDPDDPVGLLGTPSPPQRYRDRFAGVALPRPPSFDEADVSRKPQVVADRPRLSPQMVAAIQENYQQELESLLGVDDAVGAVLDELRRAGELDDTLIVYTSDNGFFHGEHRLPSEKILPYEPAAHLPLIVRGPGVPRGRRLDQLVANIDWAPTIVDAAEAVAGRRMDGRSLFGLIESPQRELGREIIHENGRGANDFPPYRALRNQRYLWVDHKATGEYELYDLRRDPHELVNLEDLDAYADVRRAMRRRLRLLQRCRGWRACSASRPQLRLLARAGGARRGAARRTARSCVSGALRLALRGADRDGVERVVYLRGARRLRATRRDPFAVRIPRRRLPRARALTLRARVTTFDGRLATYDRRLRTCRR